MYLLVFLSFYERIAFLFLSDYLTFSCHCLLSPVCGVLFHSSYEYSFSLCDTGNLKPAPAHSGHTFHWDAKSHLSSQCSNFDSSCFLLILVTTANVYAFPCFFFLLHGCYFICESVSVKTIKTQIHSVLFSSVGVPWIFYRPQLMPNWIFDFDTEKNSRSDYHEADLGFC